MLVVGAEGDTVVYTVQVFYRYYGRYYLKPTQRYTGIIQVLHRYYCRYYLKATQSTQLVWPDMVATRVAWATSYILMEPSSLPVRSLWLSGLKARDLGNAAFSLVHDPIPSFSLVHVPIPGFSLAHVPGFLLVHVPDGHGVALQGVQQFPRLHVEDSDDAVDGAARQILAVAGVGEGEGELSLGVQLVLPLARRHTVQVHLTLHVIP